MNDSTVFFVIQQRLKMSKCGFKKLQRRQQSQGKRFIFCGHSGDHDDDELTRSIFN